MYGSFLREVRTSRAMSVADLAEVAGLSAAEIDAYETDSDTPSLDACNRVLAACGYLLIADGGAHRLVCPLPIAGWFPGEPGYVPDPTAPPETP